MTGRTGGTLDLRSVLCLLLMIFCLWSGWMQGVRVRDSLFQWEEGRRIFSSGTGGRQGNESRRLSPVRRVTEEGEGLLRTIGHTKENVPVLFSASDEALRSAVPLHS